MINIPRTSSPTRMPSRGQSSPTLSTPHTQLSTSPIKRRGYTHTEETELKKNSERTHKVTTGYVSPSVKARRDVVEEQEEKENKHEVHIIIMWARGADVWEVCGVC